MPPQYHPMNKLPRNISINGRPFKASEEPETNASILTPLDENRIDNEDISIIMQEIHNYGYYTISINKDGNLQIVL